MSEEGPTAAAMMQNQCGDAMEVADETMATTESQAEAPKSPMRRVTLSPETVVSNKRSLSELSDGNVNANGERENVNGATNSANERVKSEAKEEEEEEDEEPEVVERVVKKPRKKPVPLGPNPMPTPAEKNEALQEFKNVSDRALQRLIWDIGCRYTMLAHQPEAVRAVAGLPETFPRFANDDGRDSRSTSEVLKSLKLFETETKGLLLADEMGLGKTVEAILGMLIRNKWHDAHGKRRLPSLIIGPNDAVLKQWYETLIKAGVSESRIRYFKPKSSTNLEGNIFLLMTRYNVQTVVRSLFGKVDMRNKEHPSPPLFPTAPKMLLHKLKNQYQ